MKNFNFALAPFFALLITANLLAQETGRITGTVVDSETGETLIGVNVVIEGTLKGTATDIDGHYTIRNVEAGIYTVQASYLSFTTQTITGVEVESGEVVQLDIAMQPESELLDEIVVTADVVLNNEAGLLRQRQKSISFSDAISSESISRSGAGDAAGALKKVVGASVVGGKYVYIRGLGDRYTSSHLNGTELPSADPNKKAFQLDIFPSSLLENITTIKTFTPDKPGNFSGGLVDVNTKDFPSEMLFQLSASTSYITGTTFNDILLSEQSSTDWLGYDNGDRDIPDLVVDYLNDPDNDNFPSAGDGEDDAQVAQTLDQLAKSFGADFEPDEKTAFLNQGYGITLGNQTSLFGNELGYIASLTYGQSYSSYEKGVNARYSLIGSPSQAESLSPEFIYTDARGTKNNDIGTLVNLAYKLSPLHKIRTTLILTQSGSQSGRVLSGFDNELSTSTAIANNRVIEYIERSLLSVQLGGKHSFPGLANSILEWKSAYAKNSQSEPNRRQAITSSEERVLAGNDTTIYDLPNGFSYPIRYYRELSEESYNGSIDLTIPFTSFKGTNGSLKVGGLANSAERTFREDAFDFQPEVNPYIIRASEGNLDRFFGFSGIFDTENDGTPIFGVLPLEISDKRNNYDGKREVYAGYAMIELPLTKELKVITGVRMETAKISLVTQDTSVATGNLDNTDYLPSLNVVYSLKENMNIRGSLTRTLARPTFRELAPYITVNFAGGFQEVGNPDLQRTLITNYDLRWEWFTNPGEVLALSGFYKDFENPIERVIDLNTPDGDRITYKNVESGMVVGVEFEVKKNLAFISESLRNLGVSTNLTLVRSQVDIPADELEDIRETDPDADDTRPLFGQSDYILNFDIAYENPDIGYTASVNFNTFGDRLSAVSFGATPNIYERSYNTLDFLTSKEIGDHIELSFSLKNILNPDIVESQEFKGQEFVNSSFKRGRTFSFGVKYKL